MEREEQEGERLKLRIHYGPAVSFVEFPDGRMPIDFAEDFTTANPDYRPEYQDPDNPKPECFSFFFPEESLLYTGMVYAAKAWAVKNGLDCELIDFPVDMWEGDDQEYNCPLDILKGLELRDYQQCAVEIAAKRWRGIVELPTGSGKTEIAIALVLLLKKPKTLFVCADVAGMNEMVSRFTDYFEIRTGVGRLGDDINELEYNPTVLISNVQSLYAAVKRSDTNTLDFLQECDLLIMDEVHSLATAPSWQNIAVWCYADRRIGLSATPYKKEVNRFNPTVLHGHDSFLTGLLGDTLIHVPAIELQRRGYLLDCQVISFQAARGELPHSNQWREVYEKGIVNNIPRNNQIAMLTTNLVDMGRTPLVSIVEREHGRIIQRLLHYNYGVTSICSYGSGDSFVPLSVAEAEGLAYEGIPVYDRPLNRTDKKRTKPKNYKPPKIVGYEPDFVQIPGDTNVKDLMSRHVVGALVGSRIYDQTQNIPVLTDLINAAGGKQPQRFRQKVGRTLRLDGTNTIAWIWEPWDESHYYLRNHSKKRLEASREQGFPVLADWAFARIFTVNRLRDYTIGHIDMKYDKLTVTTGMTIGMNDGSFSSIKPSASLSAILEEGDDPMACSQQLSALTMAIFYQEAWRQESQMRSIQAHGVPASCEGYINGFYGAPSAKGE